MFHDKRIWTVADIATPEMLAEKLADSTWCCCNGWRCQGYLFLNDSTGADGAQEYAVVREADSMQVESLTVSWMKREECLEAIKEIVASGKVNPVLPKGPVAKATSIAGVMLALGSAAAVRGRKVEVHIDTERSHRCHHCA